MQLALNGLAQAATTIVTILLVRLAFDRLITTSEGVQRDIMLQVGLGLGLAAISIGWLRMVERVDAEKMGQSYIHQIRMLLFKHMSRLAPRALQSRSRGAIVLRFIGDLNALKRWVSLGMVRITVAGITTLCALTALAIINWKLAMVVSVVLGLGALYAVRLGKYIRETVKESRRRRSYLAANVNEKVATMAVVQVFGQSDRERQRVKRQSQRLTNALIARAREIGLMRGITQSAMALASGAVLLQGAHEVSSGKATPGTVVAAMTIVGLLVPALRDLSRVYEYWQESRVSAKKLIDFLQTPSLVLNRPGAPDLKPGPGRLEFKDVSFGKVIKNVTVTAQANRMVVIVGPNGAGKSTLLSMAARLIDPEKGKILLDGQDITTHSLKSVRGAISMVSPDLPLLRGTVKKNLLYRWPQAPAEEIESVWELCGIHELLTELPQAELTRVTEEGHNLSLGQRQRIGLARAFLGNPRIILLDEADVHLDEDAGKVLNRILSQYKGTIIWVTHKLDRLNSADCIWNIEKGNLVDVTPQRQLQKCAS
ncbi:MAG: ABC transporter ATP-binding protein [Desulfosarcina sp.]|nr:ABC transporter ATP-binding protein [Desulfosarcina sp.]MBC2768203.1 ABC transporter ATP-binding protein [Desulfosarcina sp.]